MIIILLSPSHRLKEAYGESYAFEHGKDKDDNDNDNDNDYNEHTLVSQPPLEGSIW